MTRALLIVLLCLTVSLGGQEPPKTVTTDAGQLRLGNPGGLTFQTPTLTLSDPVMRIEPTKRIVFGDEIDGNIVICWKGACKRLLEVWPPPLQPWMLGVQTVPATPEPELILCAGVDTSTGQPISCTNQKEKP